MPSAYYLNTFGRKTDSRPMRALPLNDGFYQELAAENGAMAWTEIAGNQAIVRVRASTRLLDDMALVATRLTETQALTAFTSTRLKPRYDVGTDTIVLDGIAVATTPFVSIVDRVPDLAMSLEQRRLLSAWLGVGFGLGWRLPHGLVAWAVARGIEPDRWQTLLGLVFDQRGAFPTTGLVDDFNRADSATLGANWGILNAFLTLQIVSNAATTTAGSNSGSYWSAATFGADSEVFFTLATLPTDGFDTFVRVTTPTGLFDGYGHETSIGAPDANQIYRWDNATATPLGSAASQDYAAGEITGLEVIGSDIKMFRFSGGSWAQVGSTQTDATYGTAGNIAMFGGTTFVGDDFSGGTVVTAAAGWGPLFGLSNNRLVMA